MSGIKVQVNIGGRVVGRALLFIIDKGRFGRMAIIEEVWVDPVYRHCGIGSAVVKTALTHAKVSDCSKVILTCKDDTVHFYDINGMVKYQNCMVKKFEV